MPRITDTREIAFVAEEGKTFHKSYFSAKAAKSSVRNAVETFLKEQGVEGVYSYRTFANLEVQFEVCHVIPEEIKDQFFKNRTSGNFAFKKKSRIGRAWEKKRELISDLLLQASFLNLWVFGSFTSGKCAHALWDHDGKVYGMIEGYGVKVPTDCTEIKMSEYYKVLEGVEEEQL